MRISVLTGLFTCAVIFVASTTLVEATTQTNTETTPPSSVTIERIEAVTEIAKSPLLELVEEPVSEEVAVQEEAKVEVKHVVGEDESLSKIALTYETTWRRIYDKNIQLENPDVITVGQEIVVPTPEEVLEPREIIAPEPVVVATTSTRTASSSSAVKETSTSTSSGSTAGNRYVAGYCTWYVKNMRPDLPNNLGNASTWVSRAAAQGMATGSTPQVGAVGQQGNHVVYIVSVNGDGTVTVSDMNWSGLYVITTRTVPASNFSYIY